MEGFGSLLSGGLSSLISGGIGMAVKGVTSLFGKLFGGDSKELKAAKASYAEMQREAERLGITLEKVWKLKSVEDYQKAIGKAQQQINRFMDEQAADLDRLNKAIDKYGFSFEQLGPTFQQQRLHEQAQELINDWRVLVGSGIDLTVVNDKMSEAINEYLKLALRTGMEVPSAFRPILQSLADQGELYDENGNLLTDLSRIPFAETMSAGFDRVIAKLQELIDKLQDTGTAIQDLPDANVDINYPENWPGGGGGGETGPPGRGGGPRLPADLVGAMVRAEAAPVGPAFTEKIVAAVREGLAGAQVNSYIDGRNVTDVVAGNLPDTLAFRGVGR